MAVDEYTEFCSGLRRLTGVDLTAYKRQQMERRIRSFIQRRSVPTLGAYLGLLERDGHELDGFLDRLTINVSELYRNPEQYETLRTRVIPEIAATGGMLRAWSAGCSFGAEPYTLACMLAEALPDTGAFEVVGSDIDRRVVDRARRGWFAGADMRNVPQAVRERWFEPQDDGFVARTELRNHLRFRCENLLTDRFTPAWHLILCRNVVIYFTDTARDDVHARLAAALRPGGYLMIGATERVMDPRRIGLEPAYPFIYRKAA
jgi:chemotaxis protein methyltransferase CheR